jgi:hypothetical protein
MVDNLVEATGTEVDKQIRHLAQRIMSNNMAAMDSAEDEFAVLMFLRADKVFAGKPVAGNGSEVWVDVDRKVGMPVAVWHFHLADAGLELTDDDRAFGEALTENTSCPFHMFVTAWDEESGGYVMEETVFGEAEEPEDVALPKDTIDYAKGDDNLLAVLRKADMGWEVLVYKDGKQIEKHPFTVPDKARAKFDRIVKEF